MTAISAPRGFRHTPWLITTLILATLVASIYFVDFVARTGEALERERILSLARTAAATLDWQRISSLSGTAQDLESEDLSLIRDELRRARDVSADFRFVYLMRPQTQGDRFIFLADAESPESADYSAPGDVYNGPDEILWLVFRSGVPEVEGPSEDRWGTWVTAIAPVRDGEGRILAVLGMDVRADAWLQTLARYRAFALTICALVLLLECTFALGLHMQRRAAKRLHEANLQLAQRLDELQLAQAELRMADVVVRHTGEAVVVLDGELKVVSVNPGFVKITGYDGESVVGQLLPILANQTDSLQQLRTRAQAQAHWSGTLWAQRSNGERFPMEVCLDVVRSSGGAVQHHVLLFRDVTVQKQLEERLRELSATDSLTLLANRRSLDETLEREWHRAMRIGEPLSLIMLDIDHFKAFNDRYGHGAGDRCLQQVASAIAAAVQDTQAVVARYGGEEFAVVLPATDGDAALALAEQLRQRVENLNIAHEGNANVSRVTVSVGVSTRTPPHNASFDELMRSADQALYRAKEGGRNGIVQIG